MRAALAALALFAATPALAQGTKPPPLGGGAPGALYAYVAVPAFDRDGNPVLRADTHERLQDGFCLYWRPGWITRYEHSPIIADRVWWSGLSYTVDPAGGTVTIHRIWGPDAEALPEGGWRLRGRNQLAFGPRGGLTAPMHATPQPGWPCTPQTWSTLAQSERTYVTPGPRQGGGNSGEPLFPQRSAVNPCFYTNGHRVPGCH